MSSSTAPIARLRAPASDVGRAHPLSTVASAYVTAWIALCAVLLGFGVVLAGEVVPIGHRTWDDSISQWLADHRTAPLDAVTRQATLIANTLPVVALLGACCLGLLVARRWRDALFLASALVFEATAFLVVNALVDRPRPDVPRLDSTPSTASYPSGHVAATLALWCGVAWLVSARVRTGWVRVLVWAVAVAVTVMVGFARVYRGMHHVTDVVAGALLGAGALATAAFATAIVSAVVDGRHRAHRGHRDDVEASAEPAR